jgi:hypothetical protein
MFFNAGFLERFIQKAHQEVAFVGSNRYLLLGHIFLPES